MYINIENNLNINHVTSTNGQHIHINEITDSISSISNGLKNLFRIIGVMNIPII